MPSDLSVGRYNPRRPLITPDILKIDDTGTTKQMALLVLSVLIAVAALLDTAPTYVGQECQSPQGLAADFVASVHGRVAHDTLQGWPSAWQSPSTAARCTTCTR